MFVANRMTKNPVTITPTTTIADAAQLMRKHNFRRLIVVDKEKLVGIITDRDLREVSPSSATSLSIFELNYLLAKMQVKDIMKKHPVTIDAYATIEEAALVMYDKKIGGLPVLNKDGDLVGVITETDIFKCFVDVMGLPQGKTRLTIHAENKVGTVRDISEVFAAKGINIDSMVSYALADGEFRLVVRADIPDVVSLAADLKAKGYPVEHSAQISSEG